MFRHVVMFRWADGVDAARVAEVSAGLDELPDQIPTIRAYRHGADVGINAGNFDYVVVGDFDDEAGYLEYRDAPVHRAVIDRLIVGTVAERASVQYTTDD